MLRRLIGLLCFLVPPLGAESAELNAPNVLLIVTDDQGYGDLACHGNPWLRTPNLDRLRDQSVRLEDYHVDPVCTPTRAALMTGRYCGRVGAWAVTHGRQLLHAREITLANLFGEAGYATGMFGKWHLGDSWPYDPGSRGFDEVVCCRAGGVDEIGNPVGNDYFDDAYYRNGVPERFEGYCTDVFVGEAIGFIEEQTRGAEKRPFFVYLPTNAMHSPFSVADKYADRFREAGLPEKRAKFYGMIENFDENLGRLLESLDDLGVAENTLVLFMGDNGTAANSGSEGAFNAGMRGDKGTVYEGGHRVACFARWPARLQAGKAIDRLTSHRDWAPTLVELCGLPNAEQVAFDGVSLAPLLLGEAPDWPDRTFVVERQAVDPELGIGHEATIRFPNYAVLTERWRLAAGELFDHHADPGQTTDVAAEHPEVVQRLLDSYRAYYADVYAEVEDDARFQVGAPESPTVAFTARDWRPTRGGVIWETDQLDRNDLFINGYWPLEVQTAGLYAIEMSRYPFETPQAMGADRVTLKIDDIEFVASVGPEATYARIEYSLPAGKVDFSARLRDATAERERGPYFVRLTLLSAAK